MKKTIIENLSLIFSVDQGKIKILLLKKKEEPYKGYWIFPNKILEEENFLENTDQVMEELFHLKNIYKENYISFYDIRDEKRIIQTTVFGYMDEATKNYMVKDNEEYEWEWFDACNTPKMAFNYEEIMKNAYTYVKRQIKETEVLKKLYPSDFTVAELQTLVEEVLEKEIDRNSFRNKLISSEIIEDTELTDVATSGRPAKLYQFKENAIVQKIF